MGTELGTTDTKLLWALEEERLVKGIWRRLYLKDVAGRGPEPRRRGGAAGCSRRARGGRDGGQGTDTTKHAFSL
jgi:hypothetical protein